MKRVPAVFVRRLAVLVSIALFLATHGTARAQTRIAELPDGIYPRCISADGTTIAGTPLGVASGNLLIWTNDGHVRDTAIELFPAAISRNGKIVAGMFHGSPATWRSSVGVTALAGGGVIYDMSQDGVTSVGATTEGKPCFWTGTDERHELPLPLGTNQGVAHAVSADGSVIVGTVFLVNPDPPSGPCYQANLNQVAVRWSDSGQFVQVLPVLSWPPDTDWGDCPPRDPWASAWDVSDDGDLIIGQCSGGNFRWTPQTGTVLITPNQMADHLIGQGDFIGSGRKTIFGSLVDVGQTPANSRPAMWLTDVERYDLRDYLTDRGADLSGWGFFLTDAVTDDEGITTIIGVGSHSTPNVGVIAKFGDTDGDGLSDEWEIHGIPYKDSSGHEQLFPLPNANWLRKDIYVELDSMQGRSPTAETLAPVVTAFDSAPVPAMPGVQGALPGISLHIELSDLSIPAQSWSSSASDGWNEFKVLKFLFFGTGLQQQSDDLLREAKAKAYRYCMFAQKLPDGDLGHAEIELSVGDPASAHPKASGTNDFVVGLGDGTYNTTQMQAVAFMHELGHTLGLGHGGVSHSNGNPNYYSVMNYLHAFPFAGLPVRLGYSDTAMNDLCEDSLDERVGVISGPEGVWFPILVRSPGGWGQPGHCDNTVYTGTLPRCVSQWTPEVPSPSGHCASTGRVPLSCVNYARFNHATDWNNDGVINDRLVCANPNGVAAENGGAPGEFLKGTKDWDRLEYNFRKSIYYDDSALAPPESDCLPEEFGDFLAALPPPPNCGGVPPTVFSPEPSTLAWCTPGGATFTIGFQSNLPCEFQWQGFDEHSQTWTDLHDGVVEMWPQTTAVGALTPALTIRTSNPAALGTVGARLRCRVVDLCNSISNSPECLLSVSGPQVVHTTNAAVAACLDGSASFSVAANGGGPFTYSWHVLTPTPYSFTSQSMPSGTQVQGYASPLLELSGIQSSDFPEGNCRLICRVQNACGQMSESPEFTFSLNQLEINQDPVDVALPCESSNSAEFHAGVSGTPPIVYQWFRDDTVLVDDARLSGSTAETLTIYAPSASDAGVYRCEVTNACGQDSREAILSVGSPRVLQHPAATASCLGGQAAFSVWAIGSPAITYQWLKNGVALADDSRVTGSQSPDLAISDVQAEDEGQYSVRLLNPCGDVSSHTASFAVFDAPMSVSPPQVQIMCMYGLSQIDVSLSGDATQSEWMRFDWLVESELYPGQTEYLGNELRSGSTLCANVSGLNTPHLMIDWIANTGCATTRTFFCNVHGPCTDDYATIMVRLCVADSNCSGAVTVQDLFDFLAAWFSNDPRADVNHVLGVTVQDIFDFMAAWFRGC